MASATIEVEGRDFRYATYIVSGFSPNLLDSTDHSQWLVLHEKMFAFDDSMDFSGKAYTPIEFDLRLQNALYWLPRKMLIFYSKECKILCQA